MPLRASTVRLSERTWQMVREEAKLQGITANAWISEAVVARIAYTLTRRNAPAALDWDRMEELLTQLREEA